MSIDEREWHAWRRGGIGGSDIAALIGLSNYASPTSLYYEKVGALDDEHEEDTPRQRIGKRMESVLAAEFHDHTGLYVVGEQTWCQHPLFDWARCTVDGFVLDSPHGSTGVGGDLALGTCQMKTDGRFAWPDGVPANIRAQCIWEMGVTDRLHCWLIVMFAGFRVEVFEIPWDDDAHADWLFMLDAARDFWDHHVEPGIPPAVDDHWATTDALTRVHHADPDSQFDADDDACALIVSVQQAMLQTAAAEANEKRLKNELRALLGDKTDLVDGYKTVGKRDPKQVPNVIASWREQQSTRIDTELVRTLVPAELVEKCTTTNTSRVLRVTKAKDQGDS